MISGVQTDDEQSKNMPVNALLISDNIACLKQGADLVRRCDAGSYARKVEHCFNSSIGGHIRHIIDHYHCLIGGISDSEGFIDEIRPRIDYDARQREARIETDPQSGVERIDEICALLQQLDAGPNPVVAVKMDTGSDAEDVWTRSTLQRELQFLLSHTVHHYALIATIGKIIGIPMPGHFGLAPSTLRYRAGSAV